jgi:hypothetical protein
MAVYEKLYRVSPLVVAMFCLNDDKRDVRIYYSFIF